MATPRYLSAYNGFVPAATGQVISFIRQPSKFKLNKYAQYIESPAPVGLYFKIHRDDSVRVVKDEDFVWADGADRPTQDWNGLRFEAVEFSCVRRDYAFRVGNMALKAGKNTWKPLEQHSGMAASQAMINRTQRVISMLETPGNWGANTEAANVLNGGAGPWDTASGDENSPQFNAIKKTLMAAAIRVNLATNAQVEPGDLELIISPDTAQAMANTGEIHNYLKYGPFSKDQLENNNANALWGLPPSLYGFGLVVEDCPRVTTRAAADGSVATGAGRVYAKSATSAVFASRKGGIDGNYGAPSFSTIQLFWFMYQMSVFMWDDPRNERTEGHITDMYSEKLAAPEAGFLITSVL